MNKIVKKYMSVLILSLITCILLIVSFYASHVGEVSLNLFYDVEDAKIQKEMLLEENTLYISYDDIKEVKGNEIHYDKISGKAIISTYNKVVKIKKDSSEVSTNFENNIDRKKGKLLIETLDQKWISAEEFVTAYDYKYFWNKKRNNVYVVDGQIIEAKSKENRVELYSSMDDSLNIIGKVNKKDKIYVIIDGKKDLDNKWVKVKVDLEEGTVVGYILRSKIYFNEERVVNPIIKDSKEEKIAMLVQEGNISDKFDNSIINRVSIDTLEIADTKGNIKANYSTGNLRVLTNKNVEIYASISNGYKAINFDNTILSNILNSEVNREMCIKNTVNYVIKNNLNGIVVNFRSLKADDKNMFIQFIKEISAYAHSKEKKVVVNITEEMYSNVDKIIGFSDNVILLAYNMRTTSSNNSGSHSSMVEVKRILAEALKDESYSGKVILEVPLYSILWTEKNGKVINAEVYYMKTIKSYIANNKLKVTLDKKTNQNYLSFSRGALTYKMWLEDEDSLVKKISLVKELNLAGISIFKQGYEYYNIYSLIKENIN